MENNENLTDGARQADLVSNENADAMFGADQAETNMIKLVDGKLTSTGDTDDDVADDQLSNRYTSDEERGLQGNDWRGKTYENSATAQRTDDGVEQELMSDESNAAPAIAVADITGNPDAGSTVSTGLPSEDEPTDRTEAGTDATPTGSFVIGTIQNMNPPMPGTPDPTQPVIPPTPPAPGPEIPEFPGTPPQTQPEIQEPDQPDRSHEVNAGQTLAHHSVASTNFLAYTAELSGLIDENDVEPESTPVESMPGMQNEGMNDKPDTGDSAHPYDVNAKDADSYQAGERPEEGKEAQKFPREMTDESSVTAQDMISGPDRSDQKSTDGLDRKYNDPEAARDMAS